MRCRGLGIGMLDCYVAVVGWIPKSPSQDAANIFKVFNA